MNTYYRTKFRW